MAHGGGTRAIIAAFFANLGIAIAKFVGFLITQSASLLAESVHSMADTSNQALLLLGGRRARKAATPQHPFGFGRERYFWSFIVALVLFTLGGIFALYEGEEKLRHPHELESPVVGVVILVLAIALEGFSFRTAWKESAGPRREAGSVLAYVRRSKSPELPVVLLEDLGALLGLALALGALVTAIVTGNARWDGVGTLAIGILLVAIAALLASEMKALLIGESANPATEDRIREVIEADSEVVRLIHLATQHLGPEELMMGVKVEFDSTLAAPALAGAINRLEAAIRQAVPAAGPLYIEPDIFRAEAQSPATPIPTS